MAVAGIGHLALSFDLRLDRLVIVVIDIAQQLKPILTHTVVFDRDLPQYQTRNGICTLGPAPGPACVTPVELIIAALDTAFEWLAHAQLPSTPSSYTYSALPIIARIMSISIASESLAPVFLSEMAGPLFTALSPSLELRSQLCYPTCFTLPLSPVEQDYSASNELHDIEWAIFEQLRDKNPDCKDPAYRPSRVEVRRVVNERLGSPLNANGWMPQLLKIKRGRTVASDGRGMGTLQDVWERSERVVTLPGLLASILAATVVDMTPSEASLTGMLQADGSWDHNILALVDNLSHAGAPSQTYDRPLKDMLGPINDPSPQGTISAYFVERFGLNSACIITAPTPSAVAAYLSFLPGYNDVGLHLSHSDTLIVPTTTAAVIQEGALVHNPTAGLTVDVEERSGTPSQPYLRIATFPSSSEARMAIRNAYGNADWSIFGKVIGFVPVGGSIGLDNKFFSIWRHDGHGPLLTRYEGGIPVPEFSDLRANPRCIIEGQALVSRAVYARVATNDRSAAAAAGKKVLKKATPLSADFASGFLGAGQVLGFDPYDLTVSPERILAWGRAAHNEAIADCWSNVLGGQWVVPSCEREPCAAVGANFLGLASIEAHHARQRGGSFPGFAPYIISLLDGSAAFSPTTPSNAQLPSSPLPPLSPSTSSPPPFFPGRLRSSSSPLITSDLGRFTPFSLVIQQADFEHKSPSISSPTTGFSSVIGGEPLTPPSSPLMARRMPKRTTSNISSTTHGSSSLHVLEEGEEEGAGACAGPEPVTSKVGSDEPSVEDATTPKSSVFKINTAVGRGEAESIAASTMMSRRGSFNTLAWDMTSMGRSMSSSGISTTSSATRGTFEPPLPVIGRPRADTDLGLRTLSTTLDAVPQAKSSVYQPQQLEQPIQHAQRQRQTSSGAKSDGDVGVIGSARSASKSPIRRISSASFVQAASMSPISPPSETSSTADSDGHEKRMRAWLMGHTDGPMPVANAKEPASANALPANATEASKSVRSDHAEEAMPPPSNNEPSTSSVQLINNRHHLIHPHYCQLDSLRHSHARHEKLLGLKRLAEADEDLWIVYGALVEEYVRLRCGGREVGSAVAESREQ